MFNPVATFKAVNMDRSSNIISIAGYVYKILNVNSQQKLSLEVSKRG